MGQLFLTISKYENHIITFLSNSMFCFVICLQIVQRYMLYNLHFALLEDGTMHFVEMNFDKLKCLIPIVVEQFAYNV
jgi:hypothetical protein